MKVRTYGASETSGPEVVVLHGGPGAAGYMAPVARGLAGQFRITEPFQRAAVPGERMTVACHVADLDRLLRTLPGTSYEPSPAQRLAPRPATAPAPSPDSRMVPSLAPAPALLGSSWGAMLALAWAASHPDAAGPIVLIGCGTFHRTSRAHMQATLDARTTPDLRQRLKQLPVEYPDSDSRLKARAELLLPLYSYELIRPDVDMELGSVDSKAHIETWQDMIRLQEEGVYPEAFAAIGSPVLILHGAADPHPGRMILDSLKPFLPQIEYHEWERCGHYPWLEKHVHQDFFALLSSWLTTHLTPAE